jgi:hypothetical protein
MLGLDLDFWPCMLLLCPCMLLPCLDCCSYPEDNLAISLHLPDPPPDPPPTILSVSSLFLCMHILKRLRGQPPSHVSRNVHQRRGVSCTGIAIVCNTKRETVKQGFDHNDSSSPQKRAGRVVEVADTSLCQTPGSAAPSLTQPTSTPHKGLQNNARGVISRGPALP